MVLPRPSMVRYQPWNNTTRLSFQKKNPENPSVRRGVLILPDVRVIKKKAKVPPSEKSFGS